MQVSPAATAERLCPDCAMARAGAFRYCRACGHDFEQSTHAIRGTGDGNTGFEAPHATRDTTTPAPAGRVGPADGETSWRSRPDLPVAVGPGLPAVDAPAQSAGGRWRGLRRSPGLEADRRTILLGIAIGALAGLGVVILMSLLTGPV